MANAEILRIATGSGGAIEEHHSHVSFQLRPIPSSDTSLAVVDLVNKTCNYLEGIDNNAVLPNTLAVHSLRRNVIHQADTVRLSTLAQNAAYAR